MHLGDDVEAVEVLGEGRRQQVHDSTIRVVFNDCGPL